MAPSSDNEGAPRNGTAGRESLRDLPEHENIVEHFYDPEDQGSREKPVREKTPFSLIGNLIFLLTIAILAAIAWLVYSSWCPQKTDDLPGFRQRENAPDIPRILKQAINRDASVSFSEEDINRYLASSIHPQQHGALAIFATNPAAGIRLHGGKERPDGTIGEGYMEIIIERYTGIDSRQTISLFLTPFQSLDPHNYMAVQTRFEFYNDETLPGGIHVGGTIGSLSVPQGYMIFLLPAFENLLQAYLPPYCLRKSARCSGRPQGLPQSPDALPGNAPFRPRHSIFLQIPDHQSHILLRPGMGNLTRIIENRHQADGIPPI